MDIGYDYLSCWEWILDMIISPVRIEYCIVSLVLKGMDIGYDHLSFWEWILDMIIGPVRNEYWI